MLDTAVPCLQAYCLRALIGCRRSSHSMFFPPVNSTSGLRRDCQRRNKVAISPGVYPGADMSANSDVFIIYCVNSSSKVSSLNVRRATNLIQVRTYCRWIIKYAEIKCDNLGCNWCLPGSVWVYCVWCDAEPLSGGRCCADTGSVKYADHAGVSNRKYYWRAYTTYG